MATKITEECINCGACEPECPNTAIYAGGVQYEYKGQMLDALSNDFYYIVPEKCTECVGHFDKEQCAAVCPVDCCVPDPDRVESEEVLLDRAKEMHPEREFGPLTPATSHFQKA
jgi:ferredoxin